MVVGGRNGELGGQGGAMHLKAFCKAECFTNVGLFVLNLALHPSGTRESTFGPTFTGDFWKAASGRMCLFGLCEHPR